MIVKIGILVIYSIVGRNARQEKRLNEIGAFLGGKVVDEQQKQRTTEQWDEICETTVKLKENGVTYKKIANKFNVSVGQLRIQLKRRGIKK